MLLTADYSQIELRVLAHFTQEPALVQAFEEDEDIHRAVAAEVFDVAAGRGHARAARLRQDDQLRHHLRRQRLRPGPAHRRPDRPIRRRADQRLQQAISRASSSSCSKCVMEAQDQGYVETILGRRRPIPDINSGVISIRNGAERMAINSVVQGSAADLIKIAMLNVYRRLQAREPPQPDAAAGPRRAGLRNARRCGRARGRDRPRGDDRAPMKLTVPLKVEVGWGKNWQEVK